MLSGPGGGMVQVQPVGGHDHVLVVEKPAVVRVPALRAKGVGFVAEPYADPDGAYVVATLRDPDGNTLQLVEFGS